MRIYIDGLYISNRLMQSMLFNTNLSNDPTACDSLTVELHGAVIPDLLLVREKGLLHTDGRVSIAFPQNSVTIGYSYYVVILNHNSIETWSKNPVLFNSAPVNYDFIRQ